MRVKTLCATVAAAAMFAGHALAGPVILTDNFDTGPGTLNWPGDSVFTSTGSVTHSSVDLIPVGNQYDLQPGSGFYVDLDGTTGSGNNPAGQLTSVLSVAAGTYTLTFDLAGNLRDAPAQTTTVSLGNWSVNLTPANNAGFGLESFTFTTTGGNLMFTEQGPSNQQGNLLDNVNLTAGVPEPASWAMMIVGLLGVGGVLRSRRKDQGAIALS
jgi:hypothetical protein